MNYYEIWVNLAPGANDLEFVEAVNAFLGYLEGLGTVADWTMRRRKFGFGPEALGEFNVSIQFHDLAQLDAAFNRTASRDTVVEPLHQAVFSRVRDFKAALYRDFPDAIREKS